MKIFSIFVYNCLAATVCSVFGIPSVIDGSFLAAIASMLWKLGTKSKSDISDFLPINLSLIVNY